MSPNVVERLFLIPPLTSPSTVLMTDNAIGSPELSTVIATFALPVTLPPSAALTSGPITRSPDSSPEPLTS